MAQNGTNITIPEPDRIDWQETRRVLSSAKAPGFAERARLWLRGRRDARQGLVTIIGGEVLASPFIETLVQQANTDIIDEWQRCNGYAFQVKALLEQKSSERRTLQHQYDLVMLAREEELARVRGRKYIGDTVVSDHLARKRQSKREASVLNRYEQEEQRITGEIARLDIETAPYREQLKDAESIARSHEAMHRSQFLWKLSAYAYGASRYLQIDPEIINDMQLTTEPAEDHLKWFGDLLAESKAKPN